MQTILMRAVDFLSFSFFLFFSTCGDRDGWLLVRVGDERFGVDALGVVSGAERNFVLGGVGVSGLLDDRAQQGPVRRDPVGDDIPFFAVPLLEGHVAVALVVVPGDVDRVE
jgi:hypothetical protein